MRVFVFLPVLLSITSSCTQKQPAPSTFHYDLEAYFSSHFRPDEPGASILILKNDSVVFSTDVGLADLATKEPITSSTLFNLGSITKTFVAYGILMLQDRGMLSLDDPLSTYFPDFRRRDLADKITLRHLITHTSGLPDLRKLREDSVFYLTAKDAENWEPIKQANALNFEPGERYEYSNPAYNGLALVIEQVSGMKWQQFIEQEILRPSGMVTSTITDGPHPGEGVSHAYIKMDGKWLEKDYGEEPTFAAAGNGGVWSSVEELVAYHKAIRSAAFLEESIIQLSQTVHVPSNWRDSAPPFIGLCWFISQTSDGHTIVEHTGTQGGFYAHYVSVPDKNILYLLLANRSVDRDGFYHKVLEELEKRDWLD